MPSAVLSITPDATQLGELTRITHLVPLVADADGNLDTDESRDVVTLSTALNPYWGDESPTPRIFLGMGELVFTSAIAAPSEYAGAFLVDIATGEAKIWVERKGKPKKSSTPPSADARVVVGGSTPSLLSTCDPRGSRRTFASLTPLARSHQTSCPLLPSSPRTKQTELDLSLATCCGSLFV